MRVICRFNKGGALAQPRFEEGYTPATEFYLTIGQSYDVYAMALWEVGLVILVVDDTSVPRWEPIELFEIVDRRIPATWEFDIGEPSDLLRAIWGYSALIHDPDHHDSLSELESAALDVFWSEVSRRRASGSN
jgi:hypothetical protein